VTLISAPAGFGKTTLVSEWLASAGIRAAWLSLDEGDSDLTRFLTYLIAALRTLALSDVEGVTPKLGEGALEILQAAQSQSPLWSSTCLPRCTWSSPPGRIPLYRSPACAPEDN
jgi:LuxR family maltose regulon positive regulatory protein